MYFKFWQFSIKWPKPAGVTMTQLLINKKAMLLLINKKAMLLRFIVKVNRKLSLSSPINPSARILRPSS